MSMMRRPKVFGIGFHKTGTKTLAAALGQLGYKVAGPNGVRNPKIKDEVYSMAFQLVAQYDAFQDNPWPIIYRELDVKYPGSKFILTLRPTESWIRSVVQHFGTSSTPMREWIYGVGYPKGNEDIYISRYERHNREVIEHFRSRPHDLLVLRIAEGEGWLRLCNFLGHEIPAADFPHLNKALDRERPEHPNPLHPRPTTAPNSKRRWRIP